MLSEHIKVGNLYKTKHHHLLYYYNIKDDDFVHNEQIEANTVVIVLSINWRHKYKNYIIKILYKGKPYFLYSSFPETFFESVL